MSCAGFSATVRVMSAIRINTVIQVATAVDARLPFFRATGVRKVTPVLLESNAKTSHAK